ncbi:hypothetical protein C4K01_3197 [Pseudomonas synxantha]|nr:hypothetical protein C4K01_3197 [Pseudomonas synxantha]
METVRPDMEREMYGAQFSKLRTTACLNDGVKLLLERIRTK